MDSFASLCERKPWTIVESPTVMTARMIVHFVRRASRKTLSLPQVTALYTPGSPYSDASRTIFEADRIHGMAVYFAKHYGILTGLIFRIKAILKALVTFRWGLLSSLVSGAKIDGSQSAIL